MVLPVTVRIGTIVGVDGTGCFVTGSGRPKRDYFFPVARCAFSLAEAHAGIKVRILIADGQNTVELAAPAASKVKVQAVAPVPIPAVLPLPVPAGPVANEPETKLDSQSPTSTLKPEASKEDASQLLGANGVESSAVSTAAESESEDRAEEGLVKGVLDGRSIDMDSIHGLYGGDLSQFLQDVVCEYNATAGLWSVPVANEFEAVAEQDVAAASPPPLPPPESPPCPQTAVRAAKEMSFSQTELFPGWSWRDDRRWEKGFVQRIFANMGFGFIATLRPVCGKTEFFFDAQQCEFKLADVKAGAKVQFVVKSGHIAAARLS